MQQHSCIPLSELWPSPIRRRNLSPKLRKKVRTIYAVIGRYLGATLEEFEADFRRDENPSSELAVWSDITSAWKDYHTNFLKGVTLPDEVEQRLFHALAAISIGETNLLGFGLPTKVCQALMKSYVRNRLLLR